MHQSDNSYKIMDHQLVAIGNYQHIDMEVNLVTIRNILFLVDQG